MVDNGIFVSKSAGNDGPQQVSLSTATEKPIVVGACTKDEIAYYNLEVPSMGQTFTCMATAQTSILKDSYTATFINDRRYDGCNSSQSFKFSEDTAVLLVISGCYVREKAKNMKKHGAGLMIIGENPSSIECETEEVPSIHCDYYTVVGPIISHIASNGDTIVNIKRADEYRSVQDK